MEGGHLVTPPARLLQACSNTLFFLTPRGSRAPLNWSMLRERVHELEKALSTSHIFPCFFCGRSLALDGRVRRPLTGSPWRSGAVHRPAVGSAREWPRRAGRQAPTARVQQTGAVRDRGATSNPLAADKVFTPLRPCKRVSKGSSVYEVWSQKALDGVRTPLYHRFYHGDIFQEPSIRLK